MIRNQRKEMLLKETSISSSKLLRRVIAAASIAALPLAGWAQQAEAPAWVQVRVVEVEPDRVADWEDRVAEMAAARAEAGLAPLTVYEEIRGQARTFHVVMPLQNLAMLDDPQEAMGEAETATWVSRIVDAEAAHHVFIARTYPEYAIPAESASMVALYRRRNGPGQAQEYEQWIADELVPALREAGLSHNVSRGFMGASERMWYHTIPVQNWAQFDQPSPLVEALGETTVEERLARGNEFVDESENVMVQLRPDLSSAAQ